MTRNCGNNLTICRSPCGLPPVCVATATSLFNMNFNNELVECMDFWAWKRAASACRSPISVFSFEDEHG